MWEGLLTSIMSGASRAVALSQPVMSCWRKQPWGKESWVNTVERVRLRLGCSGVREAETGVQVAGGTCRSRQGYAGRK